MDEFVRIANNDKGFLLIRLVMVGFINLYMIHYTFTLKINITATNFLLHFYNPYYQSHSRTLRLFNWCLWNFEINNSFVFLIL